MIVKTYGGKLLIRRNSTEPEGTDPVGDIRNRPAEALFLLFDLGLEIIEGCMRNSSLGATFYESWQRDSKLDSKLISHLGLLGLFGDAAKPITAVEAFDDVTARQLPFNDRR